MVVLFVPTERLHIIFAHGRAREGGGGALGKYTGGGIPWHKRGGGGIRCWHSPKNGQVLGAGSTPPTKPKMWGGGLRNWSKLLKKGFLGGYLLIIFTFTCQHDQPVGLCLAH